ncbi:hypothetical protein JJB99_18040 [Bradyrhizobium diazoefficiens]|uniref:hypothetical protein n=1 Tax=Bradyrhizobium diazoefficiens TaxID=1355477 RepID=UPI00190D0621|nr:hypothetical protein [Bradyrhizobium diazoefficiens]QQO17892.1 hypothetical protein JJB99_18040 [Bradyrhizobium diazoefficiens]
MLSPDYQEFANRGSLATRDNTVISGLGTGEVMEITPALLDCHENKHESGTLCLSQRAKLRFARLRSVLLT